MPDDVLEATVTASDPDMDDKIAARIEQFANISVARGCGFATLMILTIALGLSADPHISLQAAGYLFLLTSVILVLKASLSGTRSYKRTEVWVMLEPQERPSEMFAQAAISEILRRTYLKYARLTAMFAALLLALALLKNLAL
jgi:hypothetical protein